MVKTHRDFSMLLESQAFDSIVSKWLSAAEISRQAKLHGWQRAEDLENIKEEDLVALFSGSFGRQGKRDQHY